MRLASKKVRTINLNSAGDNQKEQGKSFITHESVRSKKPQPNMNRKYTLNSSKKEFSNSVLVQRKSREFKEIPQRMLNQGKTSPNNYN